MRYVWSALEPLRHAPPARERLLAVLAAQTDPVRFTKSRRILDEAGGVPYATLVEMAQDFVSRHPLVDGQGNFGSIDGDPPADPQYTEVRLSPLGRSVADGAPFPDTLVNGSDGIPPHNLGEVVAAMLAMLDDPGIDTAGLLQHVPGPDFPTGGWADAAEARAAYLDSVGSITVRARLHDEEVDDLSSVLGAARSRLRPGLVVTEVPYGVAKLVIAVQIADAVRAGLLEDWIWSLEDLSHYDVGMRLQIALADHADPATVRAVLLRETAMEVTVDVAFDLREAIEQALAHPSAGRGALSELAAAHADERRTALSRVTGEP